LCELLFNSLRPNKKGTKKKISIKIKNRIKQYIKNCSGKTLIIGSVAGLNNQSSLLKNNSWNLMKKVSKPTNMKKPKTTGANIPI
jgi:hypothetical protein